MKKYFLFALAVTFVAVFAARAEVVSGITVVVNDDIITLGEITEMMKQRLNVAAKMYADDPARYRQEAKKIFDQEVEELVDRKLILHEFAANGYATNVLEAFIDDRIKKDIRRDYYGDRSRLIKTLQAEGLTYEMYRRRQRENIIIGYMEYANVEEPKKVLISPLKIEKYYHDNQDEFKVDDQVKLRMIVINQPGDGPAGEAKKSADEVLAKINSGVSFAQMATERSDGSQRAQGGERGWVDRSYFKPELAKVAFSLKAGQHSEVIELPEACYLIQVEDVRPAHLRPLADVRNEIERTLKIKEHERLRDQWIQKLKRKSYVSYSF